jgi:hypothetical protein
MTARTRVSSSEAGFALGIDAQIKAASHANFRPRGSVAPPSLRDFVPRAASAALEFHGVEQQLQRLGQA